MANNPYEDGRNAGLARLVAASKIHMNRAEWEKTGNLVAHRVYQIARDRAEFMRGSVGIQQKLRGE